VSKHIVCREAKNDILIEMNENSSEGKKINLMVSKVEEHRNTIMNNNNEIRKKFER